MPVPKNLPNRDIWAKEAANSLPPIPETEPPQPAPEPVDVPLDLEADAKAYRAAKTKARHK